MGCRPAPRLGRCIRTRVTRDKPVREVISDRSPLEVDPSFPATSRLGLQPSSLDGPPCGPGMQDDLRGTRSTHSHCDQLTRAHSGGPQRAVCDREGYRRPILASVSRFSGSNRRFPLHFLSLYNLILEVNWIKQSMSFTLNERKLPFQSTC